MIKLCFLILLGVFSALAFETKKTSSPNPFKSLLQNENFISKIPSPKKLPINAFLSYFAKEETTPNPLLSFSLECSGCEAFVSLMHELPSQDFISIIEAIIIKFCSLELQKEEVCAGAIYEMEPYVIDSLKARYLSSEFICGEALKACPQSYVYLDPMDYVRDVLKDKPNKTYPYPKPEQVKSTYRVLHLSDPHVDIEYLEGSNAQCDEPLCCMYHSGVAPNSSAAAQFWGTDANCDPPFRTFEAFTKFAENHLDIDFMLWTGDNMAHDVWHQNTTRNLNSSVLLTETIKRYLKNIPVFPIIGNHEPFPVNVYDFHNGKNQLLIDGLADVWQDWLGADATATFKKNGFYSYYISEKNLRIIGLHTQACNNQNWYFFEDPTDPGNMLEWLRSELQTAEDKNQTVYILGHIGAGMGSCLPEWSIRFKALIDRYSYVIRGQFIGHAHSDDFKVSKSFADNSTVGLSFIPGSLTTYSYLFPEFRVYEVDSATNLPLNYYEYRLNLTKYNALGNTSEEIIFDNVYNFTTEYNLPDMSFNSFDTLLESLKTDLPTIKKFIFNELQGSPTAQRSSDGATLNTGMSEYCGKFNSVQDVEECAGGKVNLENTVIRYLTGKWRKST